jgi:hypothetical protein
MLWALASVGFLGSESTAIRDHILLPYSSPRTTRRVKVEVFDPASKRVLNIASSKKRLEICILHFFSVECNNFAVGTRGGAPSKYTEALS